MSVKNCLCKLTVFLGAIRGNSEKSGTPPPPGALGNTETPLIGKVANYIKL